MFVAFVLWIREVHQNPWSHPLYSRRSYQSRYDGVDAVANSFLGDNLVHGKLCVGVKAGNNAVDDWMHFFGDCQHRDVLKSLVIGEPIELRVWLVDVHNSFHVVQKVLKLVVRFLDVPEPLDQILRPWIVNSPMITNRQRRERPIPVTIIPFERYHCWVCHIPLVLLGADTVSAIAGGNQATQPHQTLERVKSLHEHILDTMDVWFLAEFSENGKTNIVIVSDYFNDVRVDLPRRWSSLLIVHFAAELRLTATPQKLRLTTISETVDSDFP